MSSLPFGYKVYLMWFVFLACGLVPLAADALKPIWRILCWIGPSVLTLDVDAGYTLWVYQAKYLTFAALNVFSLFSLFLTKGFTKPPPPFIGREWAVPIAFLIFAASSILTVIGHHQRNTISQPRNPVRQSGSHLHLVDKEILTNPYADYNQGHIRTPFTPNELKGAFLQNQCGEKHCLDRDDLHIVVLRTSFVTQFVMGHIFKSTRNKIYVWSLVTWYRARILFVVLLIAGIYHVLEGVLRNNDESDIISSSLLWLTLPCITVPALLRIRFGPDCQLQLLLKGFLPVESDRQLWRRLCVSASDLYCALTNAATAGRVLHDPVALINGHGVSNVKVLDKKAARRLCTRSLLRMGETYIRISDGKRYQMFVPGNGAESQLMVISEKKVALQKADGKSGSDKGEEAKADSFKQTDNGTDEVLASVSEENGAVNSSQSAEADDWGDLWKTNGGLLEMRTSVLGGEMCETGQRSGGTRMWRRNVSHPDYRRRPHHETDRRELLRYIAGAFSRKEISTNEYNRLWQKAQRQLTTEQIQQALSVVRSNVGVAVAIAALGGLAALGGEADDDVIDGEYGEDLERGLADEGMDEEVIEYDDDDDWGDDGLC